MANPAPRFPASGKVVSLSDGVVTFAPADTNYQLHLAAPHYDGPVGARVEGTINVTARKAYSVPSGGNFISPIYGPPKTIQGRVQSVDGNVIVLQAGVAVRVRLPAEASAVELDSGAITVGSRVNVVALPGATFDLVR